MKRGGWAAPFRKARQTPITEPPVPTPMTKASSFPSICPRISGPVVVSWQSALSGLANWSGRNRVGSAAARSRVSLTASWMWRRLSSSSTRAPRDWIMWRRSLLTVFGSTMVTG